jgi:8-oxo-dGTP diphosphatase
MYDPRVHVGTAALVLNPLRQLLMIQRSPNVSHGANTWSVPGGWLDYGETPREAVLRELKEEVGLRGENANFIDVVTNTHPEPVDHVVCLFYQVMWSKDMTPKIMEPDKIADCQWVPIDWVEHMDLFDPMQSFVDLKWFDLLSV